MLLSDLKLSHSLIGNHYAFSASIHPPRVFQRHNKAFTALDSTYEPSETEATYGRKSYWDTFYEEARTHEDVNEKALAWYSPWADLQPFWEELVPDQKAFILVAGVGNDPCLASMYDAGWINLHAYDYSFQGVQLAKELMGPTRLHPPGKAHVHVADARDLTPCYMDDQFDAIFEKGTLDSIFLSGGDDEQRKKEQLQMSIDEMHRVVRPGGVVLSITSVAVEPIHEMFVDTKWEKLRDSRDVFITKSGFASNNVDATMFAWRKR